MANTHDLKRLVEPFVRNWLQELFCIPFENRELPLQLTSGGLHCFDTVSTDRSVIAGIKTSQMRPKGDVGVGTVKSAYTELYFLSLVEAEHKLLVLTDRGFWSFFTKQSAGRVAPGVEIRHCPLPPDLAVRVAEVWRSASNEIGKRASES